MENNPEYSDPCRDHALSDSRRSDDDVLFRLQEIKPSEFFYLVPVQTVVESVIDVFQRLFGLETGGRPQLLRSSGLFTGRLDRQKSFQNYHLAHAVTKTQKEILKAFGMTAADIQKQAGGINEDLNRIEQEA